MSMSFGRHRAAAALLLGALFALSACTAIDGGDSSNAPDATAGGGGGGQLVIATGGTGGVYYPLGGGLANVIGDNVEGTTATISETNASVDNMLLIQDGGADIAFVLGDTASDAVAGAGADFDGNPVDACALGALYNNFTQLVASADAGVASVNDLAGKRVSLGSPGSGTEVIGLRILEAAGIDPDADIERAQLGVAETVEALRDGTIDAGFWSGGLPTGALVDYASTGNMVLVPTGEYASAMADAYGEYYLEDAIPTDTYEGMDGDVSTVVVPNVLVVNTSMDEQLQRDITAVLFEQKDALVDVHPAANAFDPAVAQDVTFIDLCPGAQAYYDEG